MNYYALMSPDGSKLVEYRGSATPLVVGAGAPGEQQFMRACTPAEVAQLTAPPQQKPQLDATTLAAALVAKGVLAQGDVTAAIAGNAGAGLATAIAAMPAQAPVA